MSGPAVPTSSAHQSGAGQASAAASRERAGQLIRSLASPLLEHVIDGRSCPSADGRTFDNHSPLDGSVLHATALGGEPDVQAASAAAARAFDAWRQWAPTRRRDVLHALADHIEANAEAIALMETADTGQPLRFTGKTADRGAENFRFFADQCTAAADGRSYPTPTHLNYTLRVPIGPMAPGFEIRWQSAKGTLPTDQSFAGTKIDLGGLNYLFTFAIRF